MQQSHSVQNDYLLNEKPLTNRQNPSYEINASLTTPHIFKIKNEKLDNSFSSSNNCTFYTIKEYLYILFFTCYQRSVRTECGFTDLPDEIFIHIAGFLDSINILKLSMVDKGRQNIFTNIFWIDYISKLPKAHSCLELNGPLLPFSQRKVFFSHLLFLEGKTSLAARLDHPEAKILAQYNIDLGKDQYICHRGYIRSISGKIDAVKTDRLEKAKKLKTENLFKKNQTEQNILSLFMRCRLKTGQNL